MIEKTFYSAPVNFKQIFIITIVAFENYADVLNFTQN